MESCLAQWNKIAWWVFGLWSQSAGCRERGGDQQRSPPPTPCPMWLAARRGQKGSVCGPSHMESLQKLQLCQSCERDNEFLPVPERPFRAPLHYGMGGPELLASLESWAQLHHRFIPEYMVLG